MREARRTNREVPQITKAGASVAVRLHGIAPAFTSNKAALAMRGGNRSLARAWVGRARELCRLRHERGSA